MKKRVNNDQFIQQTLSTIAALASSFVQSPSVKICYRIRKILENVSIIGLRAQLPLQSNSFSFPERATLATPTLPQFPMLFQLAPIKRSTTNQ